jgi:Holliday junction resolvase-like predicted endonuclease
LKTLYFGKENPNFRDAGLKTCPSCSKTFRDYDKTRRFCSPACACKQAAVVCLLGFRQGRKGEKELAQILRRQGYHVTKSSGSRGLFDLVAVNAEEVRFISVKTTRCRYRLFTKNEIRRLKSLKVPSIVRKQIAAKLIGSGWSFLDVT